MMKLIILAMSATMINSILAQTPVLVKHNSPVLVKATNSSVVAWKKMVNGVKGYESYKGSSYICCGGKKTIGYGHTGEHVNKRWISEKEAEYILSDELMEYRDIVLSVVKVPLTPYQLAALTSFTFNCGRGALNALVNQPNRLNDGNYDSVSEIMPMYRRAGGKIRKGLVKRRAWELGLWNNQNDL